MYKRKLTVFYSTIFLVLGIFCSYLVAQDSASEGEYCAFCNSAVIEKQKFFEDDLIMALYTHKPVFPGHCLIIPKRHVKRFEDLSSTEASQIIQDIKKIHQVVQSIFHTSSYMLLQKNGKEVGQTVPHVHFHYIPRETGETSTLKFLFKMYVSSMRKPIDAQEMEKIVLKLRQAIEHLN